MYIQCIYVFTTCFKNELIRKKLQIIFMNGTCTVKHTHLYITHSTFNINS